MSPIAVTPKRSGLRFTLRTLLVVITLFCIGLGVYSKRARDQRRAVEIIRQSPRSFVQYEDDRFRTTGLTKESNYPQWLRTALGEDFFHNVRYVQVEDAELLVQMKYLPGLQELVVFDQKTSDDHIKNLDGMRNLRYIVVRGWEGLDSDRSYTEVSNRSLAVLGQLPKIETVYLFGKDFDSQGFEALTVAPTLKDVGLYKSGGSFDDWNVEALRKRRRVEKLTLSTNLNLSPSVSW